MYCLIKLILNRKLNLGALITSKNQLQLIWRLTSMVSRTKTFLIQRFNQNVMKKIVMMLAVLMMSITTMNAQNKDGDKPQTRMDRSEMVQRRTDRMVSRYGLNQDQAKQLLELNKEFDMKFAPMGGRNMGHRGQRGGMRDSVNRPTPEQAEAWAKKGRGNMEDYQQKLKKIMTDEQYSKYEQAQKQRMQGRGNGTNRNQRDGNNNF